jgi:hypothetical protein
VVFLFVLFIAAIFASLHFADPWHGSNFAAGVLLVSVPGALFTALALLMVPRTLRNRRTFELEVKPEGVWRRWSPLRDQFLPREEILGTAERGRKGMMLVTSDPARSIFVPPDLEDYFGFKAQLIGMGIGPIDAGAKLSFYARSFSPSIAFSVATVAILFFRNPFLIVASGIVMLVGIYVLSRRLSQLYAKSSRFGLLVGGACLIQVRLLAVLHHPAGAKPYIKGLDLLLFAVGLGDWLYSRIKVSRTKAA